MRPIDADALKAAFENDPYATFGIGICSWYKVKGGWYSMEFEKPITTVTHWIELPAVPEGWG